MFQRPHLNDPGVIKQRVDATVMRDNPRNCPLDGLALTNVTRKGQHLRATLAEILTGAFQRDLIPRHQSQPRTLLGAERAILIDRVAGRLSLARDQGKAETIDFSADSVLEGLKELTGGRGPDVCIDAVGLEAHGHIPDALLDRAKAALFLATDRAHALREAIQACRKGGTVSIPGVYGGMVDKMPMGAAFGKGLTFRMGQTHVHRYLQPLLEHIQAGEINPTFIITHRLKLDDAPAAYKMFKAHDHGCIKVVLTP